MIDVTPKGRAVAYTHGQEYKKGPKDKITSMINHITDTIVKLEKENNEQQMMCTQKLRSTKDDCDNVIQMVSTVLQWKILLPYLK